ncbi:hypothetical protein CCP4SC76_4220002 [Gammaproteobacteria bacterium]
MWPVSYCTPPLKKLSSNPEVILCESLIDAMSFWCAGYRNVTASYGTQGFTEDPGNRVKLSLTCRRKTYHF